VTTRQEALSGVLTRRKLRVESDLGKRSGARWIEQAARAITGRLIPQLPALRRFHRTLLISAGPSPCGQSGGPLSRGTHGRGFDAASAKSARLSTTLKLKMRLAIAISN
jgi:hypothetical protein